MLSKLYSNTLLATLNNRAVLTKRGFAFDSTRGEGEGTYQLSTTGFDIAHSGMEAETQLGIRSKPSVTVHGSVSDGYGADKVTSTTGTGTAYTDRTSQDSRPMSKSDHFDSV